MEIGSHSVTYPRLSGLASETLLREGGDSRQMLSKIVSAPVEGFSYPYGAVAQLSGPHVKLGRSMLSVATKLL